MRPVQGPLTIGEKVSFHRRRRGMTHATLAGLVGRTPSWLEKVENGRAPLDRVSVIRDLARVMDVPLWDLLPEEQEPNPRDATTELVLSYRAVNPRFAASDTTVSPADMNELSAVVDDIWSAYQASRFAYVIMRLNQALPTAYVTAKASGQTREAKALLAQLYHVAASVLVKLGHHDMARLCADRGDIAAQEADHPITRASLQRSIAHTLLSSGQFEESVVVVREGVADIERLPGPEALSVLGTLLLVGATASARAGERREAGAFLRHAGLMADQLGRDANEMWTSFGPTNVMIHEVTVAAELGDIERAIDLGEALDVSHMSRERQVRHHLEMARAFALRGRLEDALSTLLAAEAAAPEQVRRHFLTHELVHGWIRSLRVAPPPQLVALARRLGHAS